MYPVIHVKVSYVVLPASSGSWTSMTFAASTLQKCVHYNTNIIISSRINWPSSNSDSSDKVARVSLLLAREDGLLVSVLINLGLQIDVCVVDDDVRVEFGRRVPSASEVTWKIAAGLH